MTDKLIKCSKCKKGIFYLSNSYTMEVRIKCVGCHGNQSVKKRRITLSESYSRMKKGKRLDIHPTYSFRSATEANFARILNFLNLDWRYEERVFVFNGYKRRPHTYIMDFEVMGQLKAPPKDFKDHSFKPGFYEVKGYMKPESREKLRRLKRHYKDEFNITTVILYNKYKKTDIEFCKKHEYKFDLYDGLTKQYKEHISTWE
jgi:hypothetical protein